MHTVALDGSDAFREKQKRPFSREETAVYCYSSIAAICVFAFLIISYTLSDSFLERS